MTTTELPSEKPHKRMTLADTLIAKPYLDQEQINRTRTIMRLITSKEPVEQSEDLSSEMSSVRSNVRSNNGANERSNGHTMEQTSDPTVKRLVKRPVKLSSGQTRDQSSGQIRGQSLDIVKSKDLQFLSFHQERLLDYLLEHSPIIMPVHTLSSRLNIPYGSAKRALLGLKDYGYLTTQYIQQGRVNGTKFTLSDLKCDEYKRLKLNQTSGQACELTRGQTSGQVCELSNVRSSVRSTLDLDRQIDLDLSVFLDFKTKLFALTDTLIQSNWPALAGTGFGAEQIKQAVESLEATCKPLDRVFQALDHAEFELQAGDGKLTDSKGNQVESPAGYIFRALIQGGYYRRPKGYISAAEQAALDAKAEAEAVATAHQQAAAAREIAEFETWKACLSPDELAEIMRQKRGPEEIFLRNYFRTKEKVG